MIAPVTVIGSVILWFLCVEPGCANASGASSKQTSVTIAFFMMSPSDVDCFCMFYWLKLPDIVSTEQEPVRVFDTVHFYFASNESRTVLITAKRSVVPWSC